jgi:hypothetical protein
MLSNPNGTVFHSSPLWISPRKWDAYRSTTDKGRNRFMAGSNTLWVIGANKKELV